jgi:TonB family protein
MLVVGLRVSGFMGRQGPRTLNLQDVDPLSTEQQRHFTELLGPREREAPRRSQESIAVPEPSRNIRGFLQLEVTVAEDGSVQGARVINSAPEGVYEHSAVEQVKARRYSPAIRDGRAVKSRRLEIVDFQLTESEFRSLRQ